MGRCYYPHFIEEQTEEEQRKIKQLDQGHIPVYSGSGQFEPQSQWVSRYNWELDHLVILRFFFSSNRFKATAGPLMSP